MFAVLSTTAIPDHVEGFVSRWLQQIQTGLYVGPISPPVVERLWQTVTENVGDGSVLLVLSNDSEVGYEIRMHKVSFHRVVDFDGWPMPVLMR